MSTKQRELYPEIEPFHTEHLKVSDLHSIFVEQCGNKTGNGICVSYFNISNTWINVEGMQRFKKLINFL